MKSSNPVDAVFYGKSCQVWAEQIGTKWFWRYTLFGDDKPIHEDITGSLTEILAMEEGQANAKIRALQLKE